MRQIIYSPEARVDLGAIGAYITEHAGDIVAESFLDRIRLGIENMAIFPGSRPLVPELGVRFASAGGRPLSDLLSLRRRGDPYRPRPARRSQHHGRAVRGLDLLPADLLDEAGRGLHREFSAVALDDLADLFRFQLAIELLQIAATAA